MPIVNTNTGKVLVADKELVKKAKDWLANKTDEELEEEILRLIKEKQ